MCCDVSIFLEFIAKHYLSLNFFKLHTNFNHYYKDFSSNLRFEDVKRSVSNTRDFIVEEGERINGTLLAFENKFEQILTGVRQQTDADLAKLQTNLEQRLVDGEKRADNLEFMIEEEKRERLEQSKATHQQIWQRLGDAESAVSELRERLTAEHKGFTFSNIIQF